MIRGYDAEPENVKKRTLRNQARAKFKKAGLVQKGDGKDIDHIKPMRSGGSNTAGNLRVMPRSVNRGWNKKK